jgi:predicted amidophosphoribosyltransferase
METPTTVFSHCQHCQQKLEHTALFCPKCGLSTCSWECYTRHLATHAAKSAAPPTVKPASNVRNRAAQSDR